MTLCCQDDERRDLVRHIQGRVGLDYIEVGGDQRTLSVYFLGKLPPELQTNQPGIERYLRLEGGHRITGISIIDVDPVVDPSPEKDDFLKVRLDKSGDFSTYTLRLGGVENVDPRYDHVDFSFKIDCPSDLDCAPACTCEPPVLDEPEINYLARDYGGFRQLILDRLSLLLPDWKERHVPDLGITLVELLAYTGDYLSYYQDAVATEAYLDTARKRISIRRHTRLVDYVMHEGCNARAWVSVEVSEDLELVPSKTAFITGLNDQLPVRQTVLSWDDLRQVPSASYQVFEPMATDDTGAIRLRVAHNEIHFYAWGDTECCLERGSTSAFLLDGYVSAGGTTDGAGEILVAASPPPARTLQLKPGDVLIFEEVIGPRTGLPADADPARRHAVRLTRVTPGEDPVVRDQQGRPTPWVEIAWAEEDAPPFTFCISTIGAAPDCSYLEKATVARGNVILVDHGKTGPRKDFEPVSALATEAECECADRPGNVQTIPARIQPTLERIPLTFRQPLPADRPATGGWTTASSMVTQEPRLALPQVSLTSDPAQPWEVRYDLIASGPDDRHFVVEIDDESLAHLRFGNGENGYRPPAGMVLSAIYRTGNGVAGNVGPEAISRLVLTDIELSGISLTVRNPLPAQGGTEPENAAEVKLRAPRAFRKRLERAITADDYRQIAQLNTRVQSANAALEWSGSWYEADVAIDPRGGESVSAMVLDEIDWELEKCRRMGHDLAVRPARYVPLCLKVEVCALPHYQPGQVKAALLDRFSTRTLPGGKRGFFHPDNLSFGDGIYLSTVIAAAQAVPGVECVTVTRFHRLFQAPNHEIENGLLPLGTGEIAQLDNDPNFPERGQLEIQVRGGR
ncbi:MAG TPA: putative baseplate assembly protein [Gemmatimonadales bacterium]